MSDLIKRQDAMEILDDFETDIENGYFDTSTYEKHRKMMLQLKSEDAVEVVRCKDCRWWNGNSETMHNNHLCRNWSKFGSIDTGADDFCSYGERREP